jgi:xylulokinase
VIVGIDIGTQSLKVVVVDPALRVVAESSRAYQPRYPQPGWAEQDPRDWERALRPTIGQALARAGARPGDVLALGIAGQLDGCVAVDRSGTPMGPCLIWSDRRAVHEIDQVATDYLRRVTGITADPSHMAAKVRWLGAASAERFHQPVSYLVARLTGQHVFDHGLASTTMLYDLARRDFDDALLAHFGIGRDRLPRIAAATDLAGALHSDGARLSGLPQGLPVAVGTGDDFSTPLGAGLIEPGRAICVLGTAEVVGALSAQPVIDSAGLVETHAYPGGRFFIENPGWLAGGAVQWLLGVTGVADAATLDWYAARAPGGADGVCFLPALSGAMAPEWNAGARGCFYGLSAAHDRSHLARAVLEGCAFAMRDVLDRLHELGVGVQELLLVGGGARSNLWAEIRAEVSGLPVRIPERIDTSALGAAMLAAVAADIQPDLETCAVLVTAASQRVEPQTPGVYEDAYRRYRQLFECLRPLFAEPAPAPGR